MALGMFGKKVGMTQVFDPEGDLIPVTVLEMAPNAVLQVKTAEGKDGYNALRVGFGEVKPTRVNRPDHGVFRAAAVDPMRHVRELRLDDGEAVDKKVGDSLTVDELFVSGQRIDVVGTSKGKGYQGVVKRHGFKGAKERTHGTHEYKRHSGSIGMSAWPARVIKGKRMAGQMGNDRVKTKGLTVVAVYPDESLMLVKGAIPGAKNGIVECYPSTKPSAW